jgi:ABC-type cobalt transport system substrate-binding protein
MKKCVISLFVIIFSISHSYSQTATDTISLVKSMGTYQFYQGRDKLTVSQVKKLMKTNEPAYKKIKAADSNRVISSILGGIGGFMIGYPLGTAAGGGKPEWAMLGIGAGFVAVAIPLNSSFNKRAKEAVGLYNNGINTGSMWNKTEIKFEIRGNSIGLALRF